MLGEIRLQTRRNKVLILTFAVLVVYIISTIVIILSGVPDYYQRVTTHAVPTIGSGAQIQVSNELLAEKARLRGLTLEQYALYTILHSLLDLVVFGGAALLLLWKARGNWFAWYTVFILLFYPTGGALNEISQVSQSLGSLLGFGAVLWPLYLLYLYLFPNGRALPMWTRWPMTAIVILHLLLMIAGILVSHGIGGELFSSVQNLAFVIILVGFPLILVSQVLRYRKYSTAIERQQTKWFVGSLAFFVILATILTIITRSLSLNKLGWLGDLSEITSYLIPISLVISILRYRLWDVDFIIRRTLIYSALSATLALVFFGGVATLQQIFGSLTGTENSPFAIVLSTLLIAGLFGTLHRPIQDFIDRRFYRQKYDAGQALANFAATARDETDIEQLRDELLAVVQETVQPESASLWIRE